MSSAILSDTINCVATLLGDHEVLSKFVQIAYITLDESVVSRRLEDLLCLYFQDLRIYCIQTLESGACENNEQFNNSFEDRLRILADVTKLLEKTAGAVASAIVRQIKHRSSSIGDDLAEERLEKHMNARFSPREKFALLCHADDTKNTRAVDEADRSCSEDTEEDGFSHHDNLALLTATDGSIAKGTIKLNNGSEIIHSATDKLHSFRCKLVTNIKASLISAPASRKLLTVAAFLATPEKEAWRAKVRPKNYNDRHSN
jgi:hypothetical protein